MVMGAKLQDTEWFLAANGTIVLSTYGYPSNWVVSFSITTFGPPDPNSPQMGLVTPVGARLEGDNTQTYLLLIQNASNNDGFFNVQFQYQSY